MSHIVNNPLTHNDEITNGFKPCINEIKHLF